MFFLSEETSTKQIFEQTLHEFNNSYVLCFTLSIIPVAFSFDFLKRGTYLFYPFTKIWVICKTRIFYHVFINTFTKSQLLRQKYVHYAKQIYHLKLNLYCEEQLNSLYGWFQKCVENLGQFEQRLALRN